MLKSVEFYPIGARATRYDSQRCDLGWRVVTMKAANSRSGVSAVPPAQCRRRSRACWRFASHLGELPSPVPPPFADLLHGYLAERINQTDIPVGTGLRRRNPSTEVTGAEAGGEGGPFGCGEGQGWAGRSSCCPGRRGPASGQAARASARASVADTAAGIWFVRWRTTPQRTRGHDECGHLAFRLDDSPAVIHFSTAARLALSGSDAH